MTLIINRANLPSWTKDQPVVTVVIGPKTDPLILICPPLVGSVIAASVSALDIKTKGGSPRLVLTETLGVFESIAIETEGQGDLTASTSLRQVSVNGGVFDVALTSLKGTGNVNNISLNMAPMPPGEDVTIEEMRKQAGNLPRLTGDQLQDLLLHSSALRNAFTTDQNIKNTSTKPLKNRHGFVTAGIGLGIAALLTQDSKSSQNATPEVRPLDDKGSNAARSKEGFSPKPTSSGASFEDLIDQMG